MVTHAPVNPGVWVGGAPISRELLKCGPGAGDEGLLIVPCIIELGSLLLFSL